MAGSQQLGCKKTQKSLGNHLKSPKSLNFREFNTFRTFKTLEFRIFAFQQGSYTPTNSELLEYWVSKRSPDRLLACEHGVVDYEIEGAKVKTNVLFEAATTAGNVREGEGIRKGWNWPIGRAIVAMSLWPSSTVSKKTQKVLKSWPNRIRIPLVWNITDLIIILNHLGPLKLNNFPFFSCRTFSKTKSARPLRNCRRTGSSRRCRSSSSAGAAEAFSGASDPSGACSGVEDDNCDGT